MTGCEKMAGMNGSSSVLGLLFLITFVVCVERSKARWRTALYSLGTVAGTIAVGATIAFFEPLYAGFMGTLAAMFSMLLGMVIALIHSRKTREMAIVSPSAPKTISTEAVLERLLESKTNYAGPNPEEYAAEVDRLGDELRKEFGHQIPLEHAFGIVKEIESRYGR